MELKPGYKQTEVGVIPADWEVKLLPDVLRFRSGKAHEQYISDSGDYVCVNSKFISTGGSVRKHSSANFSPARKGDVLMVMSDLPNGRALAKAYFVEADNTYAVNQRVCALTAYRDCSKYLYYVLNRNPYFLSFDDGVSQTHLLNRVFQKCPIPLPPSEKEQRSIAEALSDIDSMLSGLEQLLMKKRLIKQAAMQELLTGKRRLPEFEGEWEVRKLGDYIEKIVGGGTPSRANPGFWGGEIPWATVKDLTSFQPDQTQEWITRDGLKNSSANLIPAGTLIASTRMALGKAVIFGTDVAINQDLKAIFFGKNGRARFFCYWFEVNASAIDAIGGGSTVKGISLSQLKSLDVASPGQAEQNAIVDIISDLESEIETLKDRLTKARAIKQAMMQELLTGRIRLV